jgi:5'(3')-deoxyribonucleotidase
MSVATLEREIVEKASVIAGKKLKKKNLMEWQCGKGIDPHEGETIYFLEGMNVECAFKNE